jgi:hypothetical protein
VKFSDETPTLVARVLFHSHEPWDEAGATTITVDTRLPMQSGETVEAMRVRAAQFAMALLAVEYGPRPEEPDFQDAVRAQLSKLRG